MLTRATLLHAIVLEKGVRRERELPDEWPIFLTMHHRTWDDLHLDEGPLLEALGLQDIFGIPAYRSALMFSGVVKARYADGTDILLDLKLAACQDAAMTQHR